MYRDLKTRLFRDWNLTTSSSFFSVQAFQLGTCMQQDVKKKNTLVDKRTSRATESV